MVMEFAGAGAQALWWLHSEGGSSRSILEAVDRYAPASLIEAVGFEPPRFTSPEVSAALAAHAFSRARRLAPEAPTFGLGLSATIATDRLKRGEHRCEIAVRDGFGSTRYGLTLAKGERDRAGEEGLVSALALRAVADAKGVLGAPLPALLEGEELQSELEPEGAAAEFAAGARDWLLVSPDGTLGAELAPEAAVFSGSFNPVHRGHWRLAEAAASRLGTPVVFELPLVNAEKSEISLGEARRRAGQFLGHAHLLLTRVPLFNQKTRLFPGRTFVVGADTAARLLEARFYGSPAARDDAIAELREHEARFLVAGRFRDGRFLTLEDLEVPESAAGMFVSLPEEAFREDLASSQLRRRWTHTTGG